MAELVGARDVSRAEPAPGSSESASVEEPPDVMMRQPSLDSIWQRSDGPIWRQLTEISDVQCLDIMEQQCLNFRARGENYWLRQCTLPAEKRSEDLSRSLERQLSYPLPSKKQRYSDGSRQGHLSRILDSDDNTHGSGSDETHLSFGARDTSNNTSGSDTSDKNSRSEGDEGIIETTIHTVISSLPFSVAVADPGSLDYYLVAVSQGFEEMTGYCQEEVIGKDAFFLRAQEDMSETQRAELKQACESGSPFTGVLSSTRKSGEPFEFVLAVRGLIVAQNAASGQDLWVLLAVMIEHAQDAAMHRQQEKCQNLLNQAAGSIRKQLTRQLAEVGLLGTLGQTQLCKKGWTLLVEGTWKTKSQKPKESGAAPAAMPGAIVSPLMAHRWSFSYIRPLLLTASLGLFGALFAQRLRSVWRTTFDRS